MGIGIGIGVHICMSIGIDAGIGIDIGEERDLLAIFYPPLKQMGGCFRLLLQAQEGNIYFTE